MRKNTKTFQKNLHLCSQNHDSINMEKQFQIDELIQLVKAQMPKNIHILEILENHPIKAWKPATYVRFVNGKNANQPNAEWQFKTSVMLEHEREGPIVIDILKDNRIGGIEFINLID
jgi:hypothetical protein